MFWLALVVFAAGSLAIPSQFAPEAFQRKHTWPTVPTGWVLEGPAPTDHILDLRIGLKERNIESVISHLLEISDPASARYGQHLSKAEVDALVAPSTDTVNALNTWLRAAGIDPNNVSRSAAGDWITFSAPVSRAQEMLHTNYSIFRHEKSGMRVARTLEFSLPLYVHAHIDVVEPTTLFPSSPKRSVPRPPPARSRAIPSDVCDFIITPTCLRTLYNTANYTPAATDKNQIGIVGYLGQYANRADLQTFFQDFRPEAAGSSFTTVPVNGGGDDQSAPGVEANLDIQFATGLTYPTPNIYYSTGGSPSFIPDDATPTNNNEPYLDWLTFILNATNIPQTFTTSYGDDGTCFPEVCQEVANAVLLPEQTVPIDYALRVCNSFAQLGARGSSVLFASGDSGVGSGDCKTNDGAGTVRFQPAFPASCPFVTTVGATVKTNPEVAYSISGGGFSNYFSRPAYQDSAVQTYLNAINSTNAGFFNDTGRAYPDVAAQGFGYEVVIGGGTSLIGGTSASSPTFASIVTLVNDARLASGKPPLGFLNPLIYAKPSSLNDITSGSNPGCGTKGFTARTGWDPVTGLGSPDFVKMRSLLG